jgi:spermidine synthase
MFVASALVFLVEPMVAKMLLPSYGGTPAVWAVSLVFFQAVLLCGYGFAHLSLRFLSVRRQSLLQLVLLAAPVALLPIGLPHEAAPPASASPALWLLGVLALTVGAPFFAVSTASPVLQRWFGASGDRASADPYFLYAAGNAGSLLGLLAYPFLVEPHLTLAQQSRLWLVGYGLFLALAGLCARRLLAVREAAALQAVRSEAPATAWRVRLRWTALAALPSSLMLGTTSYLSASIASVPLLWVIPLALYLLSFVVAFARRSPLGLPAIGRALAVSTLLVLATILHVVELPIAALVAVHAANLFLVALLVHRRLAMERPPVERLTEFYLLLSLGGVIGGVFNALIAPQIFSSIAEYPIAIVLALLLRPGRRGAAKGAGPLRRSSDLLLPLALLCGLIAALAGLGVGSGGVRLLLGLAVAAVALFARRPVRFALAAGALLLLATLGQHGLYSERTFFGVLRVVEGPRQQHVFAHGTTIHGVESFAPGRLDVPLSYYSRQGPLGQVFAARGQELHRVAVVGLGAGAIASYGRPGDRYTFYEIDPAVARIASKPGWFTYLAHSRADVRIVIGDGRLKLASAPDRSFDLIVLDAFSSDAVPVHLLTREAVELYLRKLAPGGVIAFHVTNQHLEMEPVIGGVAGALELAGIAETHDVSPVAARAGVTHSHWVVVARDRVALGRLAEDRRWRTLDERPGRPVWTDQFSNILGVVKWSR